MTCWVIEWASGAHSIKFCENWGCFYRLLIFSERLGNGLREQTAVVTVASDDFGEELFEVREGRDATGAACRDNSVEHGGGVRHRKSRKY